MAVDNGKEPDDDKTESVDGFPRGPDQPRIERLGPFKLEATLGSGGMGTIYRAYDESMKRTVALKVLHASLEISKSAQARFVREAWIAGRLDHPNIIKVHTRGEENRVSYIAMELAENGSLSDYLKQTSESIPSGTDISETTDRNYINLILEKFIGLAKALDHIHAQGFIHRDIKPHNILLAGPDKDFKLTDFGIAHAEDMTRMTRAGDFIGTVRYMSPELIAAHRGQVDKRTDIYSLGVTLYEALTLTLPFKAVSEEKLISEILAGHYTEARKTNRRISRDLETVLMKATHHDPDMRYQSATEFADDIQCIIDGRPIVAKRQSLISRGIKYVRRNYRAVLGIAAAVIVVVSVILWSFYRTDWAYRPAGDEPAQRQMGAEPTFTKIHVPAFPGYCALSPDGQKLAFMSDGGGLWVAPTHGTVDPTAAGEPVKLAQVEIDFLGGSLPVWSADGKWIAFNARDTLDDVPNRWFSMFVIPSDGGEFREVPIMHDGSRDAFSYRISLSPDGHAIAFSADTSLIPGESKTGCIYSIPVAGGQIRRLTDSLCTEPAYSPDGKMLAYVQACPPLGKENDWQYDIWVVPINGGEPIQISDSQGWVKSPVWSPDSRMIVFNRLEYAGFKDNELLIVPLTEEYRPAAPPTVIRLPKSSSGTPIAGWSSKNQIGLTLETPGYTTIYTVPATGGIATQAAPSGKYEAQWLPDGKRIIFHDYGNVFSSPTEGGQVSTIPISEMEELWSPDISPVGTELVFSGIKKGVPGIHLFTVSIHGGEPLQLTSDSLFDFSPSWSPDGKWIAFQRTDRRMASLCVIPANGGKVRQLVAPSDSCGFVVYSHANWSPDGKLIAYPSHHKDTFRSINVISLEGGDPKIVADLEPGYVSECVTWSPEGKELAYGSSLPKYTIRKSGDIWILSLDTKKRVKLETGTDLENVDRVAWSPDGEKIAFSASWASEYDFYLVEDFLPLDRPAKPRPPETTAKPKGMAIRQVWAGPEVDAYGAPSPDGRYLSYVDWETGDLAIRESGTGKIRRLTNEATWEEPTQFAINSRISPNGKLVAYAWWNQDTTCDLRLVGFDGSARRVLYSNENCEAYPKDWSSDGKQIAALLYIDDGPDQIAWVSVADGDVHILKSLEKEWPKTLSHSPDDRYLAYDLPIAENSGNYDIFLLATDGSGEIPLIEHPANDKLLGWAPGREEVLFISDRTGTWDAWVVRVVDGRPQGTPQSVKRNIGEITAMAFTQDGSYYYSTFTRNFTTCVAPFDPATGVIQTSSSKPILGSNYSPQWSPDGERLAYVSEHTTKAGPGFPDYRRLHIRHMKTGEDRELASELDVGGKPRWSPDGRWILAASSERSNQEAKDNYKLYQIDVQTGKSTPLVDHDGVGLPWMPRFRFGGEWSRDGKSIFYVNQNSIYKRDLETDREEQLYHNPDLLRSLNVSPDGQKLIFRIGDPADLVRTDSLKCTRHLMMMHIPNREVRELSKFHELRTIAIIGWSPDGQYILFSRYEKKGISLWRIPSEGGDSQKLWESEKELASLSLHPSGQQIAYVTRQLEEEICVMENFLPEIEGLDR